MDFVAVNVWESVNARTEAENFCTLWGMDGDVVLDETAEYTRALGIRGVPTNVVVGADGIVRAVGVTTPEELRAAITDLLGTADW